MYTEYKKNKSEMRLVHVVNDVMDFTFFQCFVLFFKTFLNDHLMLIRDATYNIKVKKIQNNVE